MKRLSILISLVTALAFPTAAAAATQLSYVTAGHAMAYQLLLKGLPVAKRSPDVKCATWVLTRQSATKLSGRFYADDCKGNGFVVLVAAKQEGKVITGWAGSTCKTSGPSKAAKGKLQQGCSLGSFPW